MSNPPEGAATSASRTPSSVTTSCCELAPRTNRLVWLPSGPERASATPGRRSSTRVRSGPWTAAIALASITLIDWPVWLSGWAVPLATTVIVSSRAGFWASAGEMKVRGLANKNRDFTQTPSNMNELPFMAEGPARLRFPCCIPVHPARLRNDHLRQVSWLPDQHAAPPSHPSTRSGQWHNGDGIPRSQLRGQRGIGTPFPLRSGLHRTTRDVGFSLGRPVTEGKFLTA